MHVCKNAHANDSTHRATNFNFIPEAASVVDVEGAEYVVVVVALLYASTEHTCWIWTKSPNFMLELP